jgi:DNA-directed RNA polymerase specialized sigma24 family protein
MKGAPAGSNETNASFPKTLWTLVMEAAREEGEMSREALGRLCVIYREPLRSWLQRSGANPQQLEDLTQGFMEHLLEGHRLKHVERRETKFRTFLIECLKRFVRGEWRKGMAAKRGGGAELLDFDEQTFGFTPGTEKLLDLDFALAVHRQAMARLETKTYAAEPKRARFLELRRFIWGYDPEVSYGEVGQRLGMTANHVKKAVFEMRQEYYDSFRDEVHHIVAAGLVDEETRYLMTLVAEHNHLPLADFS